MRKKVAVLVAVAAMLAMVLAMAGTAWATPGGASSNGKGSAQGQGSAHACGAFIKQLGHGKSAHARDLELLIQTLAQHGCPPAPPCVATDSCDDAPAEPPPLGDEAPCEGSSGTCVIVQSPVFTLSGIYQSGPDSVRNYPLECPDAESWLIDWNYTSSSSALTVLIGRNPFTSNESVLFNAQNWAWSSSNTFQVTIACQSAEP